MAQKVLGHVYRPLGVVLKFDLNIELFSLTEIKNALLKVILTRCINIGKTSFVPFQSNFGRHSGSRAQPYLPLFIVCETHQ